MQPYFYLIKKQFEKYGGDEIEGIIIEFGGYAPEYNKEEIEDVSSGYVIYRYGTIFGGLRYYINQFASFKKKLGNVVYMVLDVNKDNQIYFSYFIFHIY